MSLAHEEGLIVPSDKEASPGAANADASDLPQPSNERSRSVPRSAAAAKSPQAGISRTTVNYLLDASLLVVFVVLAGVSVVVRFVFPPGTSALGWNLWGFSFDDWHNLQFALLCTLSIGILVHVMLHWNWVCSVTTARLSKWRGRAIKFDEATQTVLGVGLLILILNMIGLLVAAAVLGLSAPGS